MYLAKIHVTLKPSVLDPAGVAVSDALKNMGYREVEALRLGKYMELRLEDGGKGKAAAEARVKEMCEKLLANTVIERYEFSVEKAEMKFAVLVFPGSNCDHDCEWVLKHVLKQKVAMVWHQEQALPEGLDCVIVPGGFSYGDYLRCGAIARFSPIMKAVQAFAKRGGMVFGICNGFQILTEAGLLPGALMRNKSLNFICKDVFLKVERKDTLFSSKIGPDHVRLPIAHGEGNYTCDAETLEGLKQHGQILFRYCDADGFVTPRSNPNGSLENIAGIMDRSGRILGMMPHPERASEAALGNTDGRMIFESCLSAMSRV